MAGRCVSGSQRFWRRHSDLNRTRFRQFLLARDSKSGHNQAPAIDTMNF
jgi:hypothetical protein